MTDTRKCPICESKAAKAFDTSIAEVWGCADTRCGHFFAQGLPETASIHSYESDRRVSSFDVRNQMLIDLLLRRSVLGEGARVLDFGSGEGHVARSFARRGFCVLCVEPSAEARAVLDSCDLENVPYLSDIPIGETFDFLYLVEIIEHLPDPVSSLKGAVDRLTPGGGIFVSTPSAVSLKARLAPAKSNAFGIETHLHYFTPKSLRLCMLKAGCAVAQRWFIPFMTPRRSRARRALFPFLFLLGLEGGLTYVGSKL